MKPEDLKVGMVFDDEDSYIRLVNKIRNDFVYDILSKTENSIKLLCGNNFPCFYYKLIDKVPPKIVEVEEEISVWICENLEEDFFHEKEKITAIISKEDPTESLPEWDYHNTLFYEKIGKIKRTVKKELNFNWDKGEYE